MSYYNVDFETRSTVDLRRSGVYPYAAHPTTDVLCMSYADVDGGIRTWVPGDPMDLAMVAHIEAGGTLRAWNAPFEKEIWTEVMHKRYGWPEPTLEQWVDTAAEAAVMALPRGLGAAAAVLGLPLQKDDEGKAIMLKMCKPRSRGAYWVLSANAKHGPYALRADAQRGVRQYGGELVKDDTTVLWWDTPEMRERLIAYCEMDVKVERQIAETLVSLSPAETAVYNMTQRMNDRGVGVDIELVRAAKALLDVDMERAHARVAELTQGAVHSITQTIALRDWINQQTGWTLDNLRKDTVRDLLNGEIADDTVRAVLQLRQDYGLSSTAKLEAFLACTTEDGRAKGLVLYHGATTGRWSGKLVQPQNFPRPTLDAESYIAPVLSGSLPDDSPSVPVIVSSMLRSMLKAAEGNVLMAADYAQIEARVLAWFAGQEDLIERFRTGGKIYETMAAYIFGMDVDEVGKDSFERHIGKMTILGAGFGMGAEKFAAQVKVQSGVDLSEADAKTAINGYRKMNYAISRYWADVQEASIRATMMPGTIQSAGAVPVHFQVQGSFLVCKLPSGRKLYYADPQVKDRPLPKPYQDILRPSLSYAGSAALTRKWTRQWTYGGHLVENIVQATARDLMAGGMLRLEQAGFAPVLTVHDEVVVECPVDRAEDFDYFMELIETLPRWAEGLPLSADGWVGERYRK